MKPKILVCATLIIMLLFACSACERPQTPSEDRPLRERLLRDWLSGDIPSGGTSSGGIKMEVEDDMRYYNMSDRDAETKNAMRIVNESLRANPRPGWTQTAYPRFRVGVMAFIEVRTAPMAGVRDLSGSSAYVVVLLEDELRLVNTPNSDLFARFAGAIRADPDLMTLSQRLRTALILATGSGSYISDIDESEPTWTDEDGVLVIRYYRYVTQTSSMVRPTIAACTITVDENQTFTIDRLDVGYEIPATHP